MKTKIEIVASAIEKGIESGRYASGTMIPSEHALMARYKVARGTVRAAVNRLVTKGLVVVRGKSGTYVVEKKRITFAAILLHTDQPFHAAVCSGLANCAEKTGRGRYSLLWADEMKTLQQFKSFADLCIAEKVSGVFIEALHPNGAEIAGFFRDAGIPIILLGGDISKRRSEFDILSVNFLRDGVRIPYSTAIVDRGRRTRVPPELIANGELIGDMALRLMLQRLSCPVPLPYEIFLDVPVKALPASPKKSGHGTRAFKTLKGGRLKVGGVAL